MCYESKLRDYILPGKSLTQCKARFDMMTSCESGGKVLGEKFSSSMTIRSTSTSMTLNGK